VYILNLECPCPASRCCYDGGLSCDDTSEEECDALGGVWDEGLSCAADPCPIAPDNDDCEDAEDLGALPASVTVDTTNATTDNDNGCGVGSGPHNNVWYTVTGTGNTITATTCNGGTAISDTKISVYCGTCDDLQCVTGNDDNCAGFNSFLSTASWCSQAGVTYYISVGGFSIGQGGTIQLDVSDGGSCNATGDEICVPLGSCCLPDGSCVILTEAECLAAGGEYNGDGSDCGANGVPDGGFESGGGPWAVTSTNFGTPLCTTGFCGFGGGTGPRTGDWWSWFGGIAAFEAGSVQQSINIGSDTLTLYLENVVGSGNGSDFMRVLIDGNVEFSVIEGNGAYAFVYAQVVIDTSAYNNAAAHTFRIESEISGSAVCNFFVDDVETSGESPCITCVKVDFSADDDGNALANGQAISGQFSDLVTISGSGVNEGPAIFDSDPAGPNLPLNHDPDLLVDRGNILILQSSGFPDQTGSIFDDPSDSSGGGTLTFDFAFPVSPVSVVLIEVDLYPLPQDATVTLIDSGFNTRTFTVPSGWTTDIVIDGGTGFNTLDLTDLSAQAGFVADATGSDSGGFDENDVVRIEINFASSAAVDNLEVCFF
jgi:hypothetical protein